MGELLQKLIAAHYHTGVLFLHGGSSRKQRDSMVEQFQNETAVKTMILSLKAGGTGLNLTAASHVIHYDLWWNPAVEAQATDRAFRIGQKRNVLVHRMLTQGTFEEKINTMLKEKRELASLAVTQGEQWIGELSNRDLKGIFQLEKLNR
jgi:SNF2 family DNA or RNA helicase